MEFKFNTTMEDGKLYFDARGVIKLLLQICKILPVREEDIKATKEMENYVNHREKEYAERYGDKNKKSKLLN